ncbi:MULTISPECIES: hypothetical protein [Marinobacter]|uniref:Uncharacterized protein n=1 Tax=Marinobacter profundi TaxID=2666256 RepID=A0A2G1URL8_9GAMM|nr:MULTISPECIES: hypothetical protein [Marinobacter]MBD3656722.1 hypothetical protein [Marinobacter sp.]PHQ17060.1 hypothetical protein CLH61_00400 [Marinobacter profundi]
MMLKELWRKTMGFHPGASACGGVQNKKFRILPHMTHTGEFHLERLTVLLRNRYGRSFNGKVDDSIRELMHFASRVQDQDVQRELLLFYLNCSPVIQEYLRSARLLSDDHFLAHNRETRRAG